MKGINQVCTNVTEGKLKRTGYIFNRGLSKLQYDLEQEKSGHRHGQSSGWLVVLRIYVALAVFQPYRDLEAGDTRNQSLKFKWRGGGDWTHV